MNALEKFEYEEIEEVIVAGEEEQEEKERFRIQNLGGASWALRKLSVLEKKLQELEETAEKDIGRIQHWLAKEKEEISQSKRFFETLLEEYFYENRMHDPKFKISTPYGKVSSRKQQSSWEYDNEIVISSLKNAGLEDLIRIKEEPAKSEIKKTLQAVNGHAITSDGEIIEGIKIIERPDKVVIDVEV